MAFVVRLHTLIDSIANPVFVGSVDCKATNSYMQFQRLLEDICIVDWPFLSRIIQIIARFIIA
jgi:hypothetical protein